jgi:hypothetical protein
MTSAQGLQANAGRAAGAAYLGADELLAGSAAVYDIEVPAALIEAGRSGLAGRVQLRPLSVRDLQLISRAARDSDSLAGALMVHAALQVPELSLPQVSALPIGLMEFLLAEVNRVSGLAVAPAALEEAAEQPIARAAHVLAREFGWTPQQIGELTLGQILLHLQMLREEGGRHG